MADELEKGTRIRRSILGDAHVDRSWAATTWFSAPFQEYVTRNVWEEVWGQPTMAPGVRRLMTLCMLSALNRGEEYKLHVRAALDAGLTVADPVEQREDEEGEVDPGHQQQTQGEAEIGEL